MIPKPLHYFNELLAFVVELAALAALAWWGFHTGSGILVHILLGIGAPVLMGVTWGLVAAPKAKYKLPVPVVFVYKLLIFGLSSAALYAVGAHTLAITFAIVTLLNTVVATLDRNALLRQSR